MATSISFSKPCQRNLKKLISTKIFDPSNSTGFGNQLIMAKSPVQGRHQSQRGKKRCYGFVYKKKQRTRGFCIFVTNEERTQLDHRVHMGEASRLKIGRTKDSRLEDVKLDLLGLPGNS